MNLAQQVQENIATMEIALKESLPEIPTLLQTIHRQLKKDPEIVTLLSEDECNTLVEGLKEHTGIELAAKALKKPPKKSLKSTSLADI